MTRTKTGNEEKLIRKPRVTTVRIKRTKKFNRQIQIYQDRMLLAHFVVSVNYRSLFLSTLVELTEVFTGVIDLTCKSKVSSFKIHDVVDLTSVAPKPLAPKPVSLT